MILQKHFDLLFINEIRIIFNLGLAQVVDVFLLCNSSAVISIFLLYFFDYLTSTIVATLYTEI